MDQAQPRSLAPQVGGGGAAASPPTASGARERVDHALSRLELMVEERLRGEQARAEDLARRLTRLEKEYDALRKVAGDVEGRLERAMEYIRSLLAVDQK